MEQGGSGSVKEHSAHIAGLWEVAETAGDEDSAVGRVLRLRRGRSGDPVRVHGKGTSA